MPDSTEISDSSIRLVNGAGSRLATSKKTREEASTTRRAIVYEYRRGAGEHIVRVGVLRRAW